MVPFASRAGRAAALSSAIDAAYVYGAPATDLISQKGYHSLINAEQIAKLGIPGLDVIAVATSVIKTNPTLVQDYVCAELKGSQDMTGADAAMYLSATAKVQGASGAQIVAATKGYPFILASQQLYWLGSTANDVQQPHRFGVPSDRQVPGRSGQAHVSSHGSADRGAHRPQLRAEGAGRWLPELTRTGRPA